VSRGRAHAAALAWLLAGGCASSGSDVRPDPAVVYATPDATQPVLHLVNDGGEELRLSAFRIEGPDWDAFSIGFEKNPERIAASGTVTVPLKAEKRAFRRETERAQEGYASYRPGEATLLLSADGREVSTPLRFAPSAGLFEGAARAALAAPLWLVTAALAAWLHALLGGGLRIRPEIRPETRPETREPPAAERPSRLSAALSWTGLALALGALPLGAALCPDRALDLVGPQELAQCRRGLGGAPLQVAAVEASLAVWWAGAAALVAASILRASRASADVVAATFVLGLCVAAVAVGRGTADLSVLAAPMPVEARELLRSFPALAQPVGFGLAALSLGRLPGTPRPAGLHGLFVATIVAVYLGGPVGPLPAGLAHGAVVAAGLVFFALKCALVWLAAARLRSGNPAGPARSRGRISWPAILALSLANLAATAAWVAT
jgi:hypothetical protein